MSNFKDISGRRFGMLIAINRVASRRSNISRWMCKCDCGKNHEVDYGNLVYKNGNISCGCRNEMLKRERAKHGMLKDGKVNYLYSTYHGMKNRCYWKNGEQFCDYGGRGIKVCDRWLGVDGFFRFVEDMGPRPSKDFSLDRINVDGDYCPHNCKWSHRSDQRKNQRIKVFLVRVEIMRGDGEGI